jgi:hypothetical protein
MALHTFDPKYKNVIINPSTWKHLNLWSSCAAGGCSAYGFKFLLYDAKFDSVLREFNETFTDYSLYTEVYRNDIDFT